MGISLAVKADVLWAARVSKYKTNPQKLAIFHDC